ncbi:MAG: RdgB/HAM1 family non-canonical purine NTP pyrophosphatase [Thermomicrobiales bacterium]
MDASGQRRLVVATTNQGKLAEFRRLLPAEIELLTLSDLSLTQAAETGLTFEANARTKAIHAASASGLHAIADDSGLEVDALDGAPGVFSARFTGENADEQQNRVGLLAALRDVPLRQRSARFRCVVALAAPDGSVTTATGTCDGAIAFEPVGDHGFGYDPVFLLPDGRTMAQLPRDVKDCISHRARAYRAMLPRLRAAFGLNQPEEGSKIPWLN